MVGRRLLLHVIHMTTTIYLDHHATSPLRPEAAASMQQAMCHWGNPSSVHAHGRRAKAILEKSRQQLAAWMGVDTSDLVFTSGGTESNRLALADRRVVCTGAEHPSVTAWCASDKRMSFLGGRLRLEEVSEALKWADVIALSAVNHETGICAPLAQVAELARAAGVHFHVDATAAAGRIPWTEIVPFADSITVSAHKIGGPPGIGALWIRPGGPCPIGGGGGQERGRRAGTENLIGVAGFGAAAEASVPWSWDILRGMAPLHRVVTDLGGTVHGNDVPKVAPTLNVAFPGVRGDILVMALDLLGVAVSAGSACSSGTPAPSAVLTAMGLAPDAARRGLRISAGYCTTEAELAEAAEHLRAAVTRARSLA